MTMVTVFDIYIQKQSQKWHFLFSFHIYSVWMPTLWVMELSRQLCGKMRRSGRKAHLTSPPASTFGLEIHFYTPNMHQLEFRSGCYIAEKLCVEAAQKCCKWFVYCHSLMSVTNGYLTVGLKKLSLKVQYIHINVLAESCQTKMSFVCIILSAVSFFSFNSYAGTTWTHHCLLHLRKYPLFCTIFLA